jgi:ribonuclease I
LSEELLRRARKSLKASSNTEAITKALRETVTNKEIEAALKKLIRKGRGRFVNVYR